MKILYFHQHFSTPEGATGTRSYEMARALIKRGHSVTMVCGSGALSNTGLTQAVTKGGIRRGMVDGIQVLEIVLPYSNYFGLLKRAWVFLKFSLKCIKVVLTEPYDLVFATSTPLTIAIPGIIGKWIHPSRPFVFEVRDLWPELPKAMGVVKNPIVLFLLSALERLAYRTMDAGIALSPGILQSIQKRAKNKKLIMIPNGSDLALFDSIPDDNMETEISDRIIPASLKNEFKCVFVGAHGIANGLDAALDAAKILIEKKCEDITLFFVGDGKLKPHLVARARNEHLTNCVFIPPVSKALLARDLCRFDLGLMLLKNVPAFYYGTSPNKFFDYLAAGLPIITNYPGWVAEMVQNNNCGKAITPDDPDALAQTIYDLSQNPTTLTEMGKCSRKLAESEFARDKLADQFVEFIETNGGIL